MNTQEQTVISSNKNNNKELQSNSSFNSKNRFKILSILLSIILVFAIIIVSFVLLSIKSTIENEGYLALILIRIAFIIFTTPVAIILFFIGHRIDDAKNKLDVYRYPIWVEIIGIITGISLGWVISILWVFIITVSQGTIWANPVLYIPFPVITPLITYLCFKTVQFIYSLLNKKARRSSIKIPLIAFLLALPILIYSIYIILQINQEVSYQNQVTFTNFKETKQGNKHIFTAGVYAPQSNIYNIIAIVDSSSKKLSAGILRLNGVENIDGLNNFILNKGINKMIYYPNSNTCSGTRVTVSFDIRKLLADRFTTTQAKVIKETIKCHE